MAELEYFIENHTDTAPDINVIEMVVCKEFGITRKKE